MSDAALHGRSGTIDIATVSVGEITAWTIDETVDAVETTAMGQSSKTYAGGLKDASGSISCWWDPDDAGQEDILDGLAAGTGITVNLYPSGVETQGAYYYTGSVIVNGNSVASGVDSVITASFTFRGALTLGTVA